MLHFPLKRYFAIIQKLTTKPGGKPSCVHAYAHVDVCTPVCTAVPTLPNQFWPLKRPRRIHPSIVTHPPALFPRTVTQQKVLVPSRFKAYCYWKSARHREPLALPRYLGWNNSRPWASPFCSVAFAPSARISRERPAAKVRNTLANTTTKYYQDRLKSKKSTH